MEEEKSRDVVKRQINILARIFAYSLLEQRIADKEEENNYLRTRIADLENRLFIRFGLPGTTSTDRAAVMPGYKTGRQRVQDMLAGPSIKTVLEKAPQLSRLDQSDKEKLNQVVQ